MEGKLEAYFGGGKGGGEKIQLGMWVQITGKRTSDTGFGAVGFVGEMNRVRL